jgi:hypothetical protein
LAVSQQGTDLNTFLRIRGQLEAENIAADNWPIVATCAQADDVTAELDFYMHQGGGDYVWRAYSVNSL